MAQDLFGRHPGRRALRRSCKCCAPIHFLAVVPTLHTKFWQRAGHALVQPTAVHVLLRAGILWPSRAAFRRVIPRGGVPALFLPSPDERRIRSTGTKVERSHTWLQSAICFGNLIAWIWFTFQFVTESPELGLAFAVSARFSPPRGGKLPPAPARCGSDECLLALSFCSRWTMRWGKAISIPAARSAAFTATATSLCTNGDCETSSVVKPSTKTSASSPNCFSTASGGGSSVTFGCAAAVFRSNAITCSGSLP